MLVVMLCLLLSSPHCFKRSLTKAPAELPQQSCPPQPLCGQLVPPGATSWSLPAAAETPEAEGVGLASWLGTLLLTALTQLLQQPSVAAARAAAELLSTSSFSALHNIDVLVQPQPQYSHKRVGPDDLRMLLQTKPSHNLDPIHPRLQPGESFSQQLLSTLPRGSQLSALPAPNHLSPPLPPPASQGSTATAWGGSCRAPPGSHTAWVGWKGPSPCQSRTTLSRSHRSTATRVWNGCSGLHNLAQGKLKVPGS